MKRLKTNMSSSGTIDNNTIYKDSNGFKIKTTSLVAQRQYEASGDIIKTANGSSITVPLNNSPLLAHYQSEKNASNTSVNSNIAGINNISTTLDVEEIS